VLVQQCAAAWRRNSGSLREFYSLRLGLFVRRCCARSPISSAIRRVTSGYLLSLSRSLSLSAWSRYRVIAFVIPREIVADGISEAETTPEMFYSEATALGMFQRTRKSSRSSVAIGELNERRDRCVTNRFWNFCRRRAPRVSPNRVAALRLFFFFQK